MNKGIGPKREKVFLFRVVLVVSLLCFLWPVCLASAGQNQVYARWVPDGDTLFLRSGERVRLRGIDAPEIGHDNKAGQFYALRSRQELWSLVQGRVLNIDSDLKKDRFGRLLAYVRLKNGQMLNKILLEKGCAFCCFSSGQSPLVRQRFLKAQRQAMVNKCGFWAEILSLPMADKSYLGNKSSTRFHDLSCPFGQKIHEHNRLNFTNIRKAFWLGFSPCRRCTPWPLEKRKQN